MTKDRVGRLARDERGNVTTIFAIAILPAMALVGGSIDYFATLTASTNLQTAVDAAVLSAVQANAGSQTQVARAVYNASLATKPWMSSVSSAFQQNADGTLTGSATVRVQTVFSQFVGRNTVDVTRSATAQLTNSGGASVTPPASYGCLLMLDPTVQNAFDSISASNVNAANCELHVNSNGKVKQNPPRNNYVPGYAAYFESASQVTFKKICVNGPIGTKSGAVPNEVANCTPVANPFAGKLPVPVYDTTNAATNSANAATPGVYVGNTTISGAMAPGLYIFKTAPNQTSATVTVTGQASGVGVTFYFADEGVVFNATGEGSKLYAPTSGTYAGILMYMPDSFTNRKTVGITSLDKTDWKGLMYTPNWNMQVHSWSEAVTNVTWVANTMRNDSMSSWTLNPGPLTIGINADGTSTFAYVNDGSTTVSTTGVRVVSLKQ